MTTRFLRLNNDWNAEPNAPEPRVTEVGADLEMTFLLNDFQFKQYHEVDIGTIRFENCWRYRLGATNDEGWYRGQCRFSKLAPKWGELYDSRKRPLNAMRMIGLYRSNLRREFSHQLC